MPHGLPPPAAADLARRSTPKAWWRSRTLLINGVVLVLAAAEAQLQLLQPLLPVDIYSLVAFGLPVVNALLRVITVQPLASGRTRHDAAATDYDMPLFEDTLITEAPPDSGSGSGAQHAVTR